MTVEVLFNRLLEKYKFLEPIPENIQRYFIRSRKKILKSSLKAVDRLSLFYRVVISVYYNSRIIGLKPSLFLSNIIAGIISAVVITVFFGSIALAAYNYKSIRTNIKNLLSDTTSSNSYTRTESKNNAGEYNQKNISTPGEESKLIISSEKRIRLGVDKFSGDTVDSEVLNTITDTIAGRLKTIKGENSVINLRNREKDKNVNRLLLGSVRKLGDTYTITAKIVDVEKSNVLYATDENVESEEELISACTRIAEKISHTIK